MRFRFPFAAAIAGLAIAATAAPALAHEELSPKTVTVGEPAYLALTVANEKDANLVKIRLDAPSGVEFGTPLEGKDGWATTRSSGRMTWDGTVKPEHFETFRFEMEAPDQPGTLAYKVTLSFADGTSEEHEVDVTAAAGTAGAGTGSSATTITTGATATSASPTTAAAAPADSGSGPDGGSGTAKAALAVSIVALLVAAGALAVGARRSGGNRASGGGAAPGGAQDW